MRSGLCQSVARGRWTKPIRARIRPRKRAPAPSGGEMKARFLAAALLAAALSLAASTASGSVRSAKATTLTVWLQDDAKNGWADAVAAATRTFQAKHAGVNVDVQYQQWTTHLTKFDAALAGNNAPDVIEMGNSETAKYMQAGAFAHVTAKSFPNSNKWLSGLRQSCTLSGKLL